MDNLKRKILVNALGDDYEGVLEDLYKALGLYPGGCLDLVDEVKSMFSVLSLPTTSVNNAPSPPLCDYRFRYLLINNYRKFDKPKACANYYGLPFCEYDDDSKKNHIRNLFLLGGNGAGKSSLFNSMEYAFTDMIGEADYRGINDLEWYVHRYAEANPEVKVFTEKGVFDLDSAKFKETTGLDVHRFFFSENSIYDLSGYMIPDVENDQADWVPFFCYALGLEDTLGFLRGSYRDGGGTVSVYDDVCVKLKEIEGYLAVDYAKERKKTQTYINDACLVLTPSAADVIEEFNTNLHKLLEQSARMQVETLLSNLISIIPDDILYISSLNEFRSNIEKLYHQYRANRKYNATSQKDVLSTLYVNESVAKEDVLPEIEAMLQSLKVILEHCHTNIVPFEQISNKIDYLLNLRSTSAFYGRGASGLNISELLDRLKDFRARLDKELASSIQSYVDTEFVNMVVETLKDKFIDVKTETLVFENRTYGSVFDDFGIDISVNGVPVNKYFNTFRFRLFTLCLLSAFNFKAMQEYNFRFPFVFDDIFFANDYRNKAELYNFFKVLEKDAALYLGDKSQLQVIFFTHDEQFLGTLRFNKDEFFAHSMMARLLDKQLAQTIAGEKYVDNDRQKECFLSLSQKINR